MGKKNIWKKEKRLARTSALDALLEVQVLKDWNWHSASLLENPARAIFPLTWEIIQGSLLRKHVMDLESWCLANFHTSGLPGSLCSSANKDLREPSSARSQPLDPYLISPGRRPSALAWPPPFRASFISNTKWSRVVKWSLIFLIADSRVPCWFSVTRFILPP